ncbi:hypothetical protein B0I35DRAFT_210662 [Stachybotrys elegans]|uniref:Uncharacterized protein n=1 Tax=Stachybotrys elegans TaxID=80388 RepID=A0A8K0SV36_9HYPO|nr:hypothetical protein B0I35DRAFT_210662 [Stachybotrys elegans]
MTPKTAAPSPESMDLDEFHRLLNCYPDVLDAAAQTKDAKPGQRSLQELDAYRYSEAVQQFGSQPHDKLMGMELQHVQLLVEWKLRHGKFRPMLMKLVSSNDASSASQTIKEAIDAYRGGADVPSTIGTLTKLKGIGPATASLLLAVHDARRVIFFSDEAFYWLCCNATKTAMKYNTKEYDTLRSKAQTLMDRLSVGAMDVEKVAYVVMKQADLAPAEAGATAKDSSPAETKPAATAGSGTSTSTSTSSSAKRKPRSDGDVARGQSGTRRSKRARA